MDINWDDKKEFEKIFNDKPAPSQKDPRFSKLFQPLVIYKRTIKTGIFKKTEVPVSFYCDRVFIKKEDAELFLRNFLGVLIKDGSIDEKDAIKDNGINSDKIICGVQTLSITELVEHS